MLGVAGKDTWDMQLGTAVSPVRMKAVGKQVLLNHTVNPFSHTYDFFNFEPSVDPHHFEVLVELGLLLTPRVFVMYIILAIKRNGVSPSK